MPKRRSKFNATKVTVDGIIFDSKLEGECFCHFRQWCHDLKLTLELQPKFELIPVQKPFKGTTLRAHTYSADFRVTGPDLDLVIDVKSVSTAKNRSFIINEKLMLSIHGILIERIHSADEADQLMIKLLHA